MSEADGVDGGAICKRGFIHLQFAEKLEAPEAERHLGSRILELDHRTNDQRTNDHQTSDHRGLDHREIKFLQGSFSI
ncbi:hypothetical protein V1477_005868 [Vespula maculifrons]|uniref:Uncharacterized protein n=1 Tax=Vespula maculifrons TaxID=7453 RepID=A0ABD2CLH2_VESMC